MHLATLKGVMENKQFRCLLFSSVFQRVSIPSIPKTNPLFQSLLHWSPSLDLELISALWNQKIISVTETIKRPTCSLVCIATKVKSSHLRYKEWSWGQPLGLREVVCLKGDKWSFLNSAVLELFRWSPRKGLSALPGHRMFC